jgi:Flp pilus assembly protein TadG
MLKRIHQLFSALGCLRRSGPDRRTERPRHARCRMPVLARLSDCRRGATAVEFALIAVPFMMSFFAFIEIGIVFLAQEELQTATTEAARLIMTGQAQTQNLTASQFQQKVCANAVAMFNCSGIYVNVQKFSSFSGMSMLNPLQNGTFNSANLTYNSGNPGDIVLVQVFYQWPVVTALLGFNLSNMNGSNRLLVATAVFRNEPY